MNRNFRNWLRDRVNGVMDNIVANVLVAGIAILLAWLGVLSQWVNWTAAAKSNILLAIMAIGIISLALLIQRRLRAQALKSVVHKALIPPPNEFVGRVDELNLFRNFLKGTNKQLVLSVHGPPGIGKSWLLNRFAYDAAHNKTSWAKVDFRNTSFESLQVLYEIQKQLGSSNFERFQQSFDVYARTRQQRTSQGNDVLSDQTSLLIVREREAIQAFTADYIQLANHRRVVLIFDTFENVDSAELSIWLEEVLKPLIFSYRFSSSALVFGGWNSLKWHDGWESIIQTYQLHYFTVDEVHKRLEIEIDNQAVPSLVSAIYKYTKGHPLAVGLAATLLGEARRRGEQVTTKLFEDQTNNLEDKLITEFLTERILERINPLTSHLVRCCAIPRWFDAGIANLFITDENVSQDLFKDLISYRAFIQPHFPIGYEYHEIVRQLLIRQWERDNRQEYIKLNRLILDQLTVMRQNGDSALRDKITLDIIYHGFNIEEELGMSTFRVYFKEALDLYRLDFCEALLREVKTRNVRLEKNGLEIEYRSAQVLLSRELWQLAEDKLKEIAPAAAKIAEETGNGQLAAITYYELGNCEARRSHNVQAVELFQTSLGFLDAQSSDAEFSAMDILIELGMALLVLGQLTEAEKSLKDAEVLASHYPQKTSKLFLNLQVLYLTQGKWQSVLDYHRRFEQLPPNYKNEVDRMREGHHFAEVTERTGKLSEALAIYKKNYEMARQLRNPFRQMFAHQGIARVLEDMGQWEDALEKFREALVLENELGGKSAAISYRAEEGRVLFKAGRLNEAEVILETSAKASIELGHTRLVAEISAYLGAINAIKGNWVLAKDQFSIALSTLEKHGYLYQETLSLILLLEYGSKYLEINSFNTYLSRGKLLSAQNQYHDLLARFLLIEGTNILNQPNFQETDQVIELYNQACLVAMTYNWYLFETITDSVCNSLSNYALSNHREVAMQIATPLMRIWSEKQLTSEVGTTQNRDTDKKEHQESFVNKLSRTLQEIKLP